jgi:hypothetical protein
VEVGVMVADSGTDLMVEVNAMVLGSPNANTSVDHTGFVPFAQRGVVKALREERDRLLGLILRETPESKLASRQHPTLGPNKSSFAAFVIAFIFMFLLGSFLAFFLTRRL